MVLKNPILTALHLLPNHIRALEGVESADIIGL